MSTTTIQVDLEVWGELNKLKGQIAIEKGKVGISLNDVLRQKLGLEKND